MAEITDTDNATKIRGYGAELRELKRELAELKSSGTTEDVLVGLRNQIAATQAELTRLEGQAAGGGGDGGGRSSSAGASESVVDEVRALSAKMGGMDAKISGMDAKMSGLVQATGMVMRKALCPWDRTSHSRSHAAANSLTPDVLRHYGFGGDLNRCHLCGHVDGVPRGPKAVVITAHIFPNHTGGDGLHLFGLKQLDIDNPRNFLRLHNQVEKAFDSRRLTIVHHGGQLCAYLLDPSLRATRLTGTNPRLTFDHFHLRPLTFLNDERPFRRLLAAHAADCFAHAESMGWIGEQQQSEWEIRFNELASFSLDDAKQENIKQWLLAVRPVREREVDNAGAGAAAAATAPDLQDC